MASEKTKSSFEDMLNTAALGMAGETGEVVDIIKKILYHGMEVTEEVRFKLIKELGDNQWYVALACTALGVLLDDVQMHNVTKLRERYKSGTFTVEEFKAKEAAKLDG